MKRAPELWESVRKLRRLVRHDPVKDSAKNDMENVLELVVKLHKLVKTGKIGALEGWSRDLAQAYILRVDAALSGSETLTERGTDAMAASSLP